MSNNIVSTEAKLEFRVSTDAKFNHIVLTDTKWNDIVSADALIVNNVMSIDVVSYSIVST